MYKFIDTRGEQDRVPEQNSKNHIWNENRLKDNPYQFETEAMGIRTEYRSFHLIMEFMYFFIEY